MIPCIICQFCGEFVVDGGESKEIHLKNKHKITVERIRKKLATKVYFNDFYVMYTD